MEVRKNNYFNNYFDLDSETIGLKDSFQRDDDLSTFEKLEEMNNSQINSQNESTYIFNIIFNNDEEKYLYHTIKNISSLLMIIISIYFYYLSLESCCFQKTQFDCLKDFNEDVLRKLFYYLILSAIIFSFIVFLIITRILNYLFAIPLVIIYYYFLFIYDTGFMLDKHGFYNMMIFLTSSIIFISFSLLIYGMHYFNILKYGMTALIIISLFLFTYKPNLIFETKCENWTKGLGNSFSIDYYLDQCILNTPSSCLIDKLDKFYLNEYCYNEDIDEKRKLYSYYYNLYSNPNLNNLSNNNILENVNYIGMADTRSYNLDDVKYLVMAKKTIQNYKLLIDDNIIEGKLKMSDEYFTNQFDKNYKDIRISNVKNKENSKLNFTDLPEVIIDLKKNKININVFRNETLIEESNYQIKKEKEKFNYMVKNIQIIYIDAFSRQHFFRKFPKTKKFIEQFYINGLDYDKLSKLNISDYSFVYETMKKSNLTKNKFRPIEADNETDLVFDILEEYRNDVNFENNEIFTFQFFKYHSLGFFTQINTIPGFWGRWWISNEKGKYYMKMFKEKGYITGFSQSSCDRHFFDQENDQFYNLDYVDHDHELSSLSCDPNYYNPEGAYSPKHGPMSFKRRCLFGKDVHDYQLEYLNKFWRVYSDMPKIFTSVFIDAHESSHHVVGYLDEKIYNHLNNMHNQGYLNDTLTIIIADHGNNMPTIYDILKSEDYNNERYLPSLFIIAPKEFSKKYGKNLLYNEQTWITPWDIYQTFVDLSGDENINNFEGSSILHKISNEFFNCRSNYIESDKCMCKIRENDFFEDLKKYTIDKSLYDNILK